MRRVAKGKLRAARWMSIDKTCLGDVLLYREQYGATAYAPIEAVIRYSKATRAVAILLFDLRTAHDGSLWASPGVWDAFDVVRDYASQQRVGPPLLSPTQVRNACQRAVRDAGYPDAMRSVLQLGGIEALAAMLAAP